VGHFAFFKDEVAFVSVFVIDEEILYFLALVTEAEYEVPEAVMGVALHDMPEDGHSADFDQRLWDLFRLLPEPGPLPSAEYDHLRIRTHFAPHYTFFI
jgi:hypothetical protein